MLLQHQPAGPPFYQIYTEKQLDWDGKPDTQLLMKTPSRFGPEGTPGLGTWAGLLRGAGGSQWDLAHDLDLALGALQHLKVPVITHECVCAPARGHTLGTHNWFIFS